MTARAAHAAGFAPEVHYSEPGVMVTAFLGAKTYGADDVRANIGRIAELIRGFHDEMPKHVSGAGFMFWPFHVIRDYARTLEAGGSRMTHALPGYLALADELERAQVALPVVFGHNDLLPANFLDDGERLWLIDFEYAGFSTAMFDLAGAASNAGMSADESDELLGRYFGSTPSAEIRRSHAAMQCASLLREAMWSMVSELHLDAPGVDYVAYTAENLARLDAALDAYRTHLRKEPLMTLPTHAEIVVIGGGIIGCSTAYHLARDHKADVVLLEQGKLTSGSTWHAAGLVGQLRSSASITRVLKYSVDLYKRLDAETGLATGWKMTGCLRLATNQDRWTEFRRLATTAKSFGMDMHLISPAEVKAMWPLMETGDLVGASWLPTDGQASPSDITQSLAKGARMNGAKLFEDVRVTGFAMKDGRITAVKTDKGDIACDKVVNCAGQWARQVGAMAGVSVPLQPVKHQYIITEKIDGLAADAPTIRDPDRRTYFKEEVGGLVMGGYEPNPQAWMTGDVPGRLAVPPVRRRLGSFRAAYEPGDRPRAGAGDGRRQADDQRPGELHARRQFHPRRWRPNARTCSSAPASTPSASRRAAAPAGCWRNGSSTAKRRSTCGSSTSAASPTCIATATGCATARSKPMASTTRSASRTRNTSPAGRASSRRSMSG